MQKSKARSIDKSFSQNYNVRDGCDESVDVAGTVASDRS